MKLSQSAVDHLLGICYQFSRKTGIPYQHDELEKAFKDIDFRNINEELMIKTLHVKGKCNIVDKVCTTCNTDFSKKNQGLVQIRRK